MRNRFSEQQPCIKSMESQYEAPKLWLIDGRALVLIVQMMLKVVCKI